MAATGAGLGIMGGILGGIGDIYKAAKYKRPKFPKASTQELRQRKMTMQELENARSTLAAGQGMYNQTLPIMYNAIPGVSAEMQYDPQAQAEFQQAQQGLQGRLDLQDQLAAAKGTKRTAKGRAAKKAAKGTVRGLRQQIKGGPTLQDLQRGVYSRIAAGPQMKITQKAPTQTDQNAQQIQDALSNRTLEALHGGVPNPTLEHSLARENAQLEDHMRAQLGPDWENSTTGIQARQQFDQYANDQRDASNRHDIEQMYSEQLGGQNAQLGFAGHTQQLLGSPSLQSLRFAQGQSGIAGDATQAQSPWQFDRNAGWAEQQNPSQIYGDMMAQSGDRWIKVGGQVGTSLGDGGGSPQGGAPSGGSSGGGGSSSGGSW